MIEGIYYDPRRLQIGYITYYSIIIIFTLKEGTHIIFPITFRVFASYFWKRDFQNERGDREDGGEIESWEKMHLYYFYYTVFEITEKVSINIASKASYVYILSGQK